MLEDFLKMLEEEKEKETVASALERVESGTKCGDFPHICSSAILAISAQVDATVHRGFAIQFSRCPHENRRT